MQILSQQSTESLILLVLLPKTFHRFFVYHLSMVYLASFINYGDVSFHLQLTHDAKIHHLC